jgi:SAM-dependent methyltransferase
LVKEVMEKCARNNLMLRPQSIEFHNIDGRNTIYRDGLFDLVFSVNAFEHIPDPILAFQEAIRVCKPGGLVYLKFDPLWHSAYGHHMFAFDFDPWEHLLLSDEEFKRKIVQKGGSEKDIYVYDHDMNRKKYDVFKSLMTPPPPGVFSTFHFDRWSKTPEEDPYAGHPNYEACLKKGFDAEDLLTRGILFTGIRESY